MEYLILIIFTFVAVFGYIWSEKREEKIEKEIRQMDNKIIEEFLKNNK